MSHGIQSYEQVSEIVHFALAVACHLILWLSHKIKYVTLYILLNDSVMTIVWLN